ncbi:MAG: T9SS type B sorting domain-containing protein [Cyclobacteriaceae bacterium]|nr:T9SS type B sorting domain-containing protein [Cyclobacteriaceae bacterium]
MVPGIYVFGLTVTDDDGATGYDEMKVTVEVANVDPQADAGDDKTIQLPTSSLVLEGHGTDSDGSIATYEWSKQSGPTATLVNPNTAILTLKDLVQGNYTIRLTVTDNKGATAYDEMKLIVEAVNSSPTASAGLDKALKLPVNSTNLEGSGIDNDGTVVSYSWVKVSGGVATLTNTKASTLSIEDLVAGEYIFGLTVSDDDGATGYDEVKVTVDAANQLPQAKAGSDVILYLPTNSISIDGMGLDGDGTIVTYQWLKKSGPAAIIDNTDQPTVSLSSLVQGTYVLSFTVEDNDGGSATDEVSIFVLVANEPPKAFAGDDIVLQLPTNSTTISGKGSDADGIIASYAWEKVSGPDAKMENMSSATLKISELLEGNYVFGLTVVDDDGASNYDEVNVNVTSANSNPQVDAGEDQQITLPTNTINITAFASDQDGSVISYLWEKTSGGSASLININTSVLSVEDLVAGVYTFSITVTDNDGASAADLVKVTVLNANSPPKANAGTDINLTLPTNSVIIEGMGSDKDGSVASQKWIKVSGPGVTMSNDTKLDLSLNDLLQGTYVFGLTVFDNLGASGYDEVIVNVSPEPVNIIPNVDAGPDIAITLPTNTTKLSSTSNDPDGSIINYLWEKSSGGAVNVLTPNQPQTDLNGLAAGQYVFTITVTDNKGAKKSDEVKVTVFEQAKNNPPVVKAGTDINIRLPQASATFATTVTDSDGTIASFSWFQVSGPNTAMFNNKTIQNPSISGLIVGKYTFRLTATDNDGEATSDEIVVSVNDINQAPGVDAGSDILILLPDNSVSISADASDLDGTIATYFWKRVSGPNGETMTNVNTQTVNISNLSAGIYVYQVDVTDNEGAIGSDQIKVTVQALNKIPQAYAGVDFDIQLPTDKTNVYGSGKDDDGTIVTYGWSKLSGPVVTMVNQNTATLSLENLLAGTYSFRLTVTDNSGASNFDDVIIKVLPIVENIAPQAFAGNDKSITLPTSSVTFDGSGIDSDGSISAYFWEKINGGAATLSNINNAILSVKNLVQGVYVFRLTVTDNAGAKGYDEVELVVNPEFVNQPPRINAGPDIKLTLPVNSVNITGKGNDLDGTIISYLWQKTSGPTATLSNTDKSTLSVSNLSEGSYSFTITVTDDKGASASDKVDVFVSSTIVNQLPQANAGEDREISLPTSTVTLDGNGSDPDGSIASYAWIKISGPTAKLTNDQTARLSLSELVSGTYTFRLTVVDNLGLSNSDEVKVLVHPEEVNKIPFVNAGDDKVIVLPTNSINIEGGGSDSDGTIVSYKWTKISGPAATMSNTDKNLLVLAGLVEGTYTFRLTVIDDEGASAFDQMVLTVNAGTVNQKPVAYAGINKSIKLPTNTVVLDGSGSDADGSIAAYRWQKVTGAAAVLSNINTASLTVNNMVAGTYIFRLTVTDDDGDKSSDDVRVVVVTSDVNTNPVVNAGNDINIQLPTNSANLTALASDANGSIDSYQWKQIGGSAVTTSDLNQSSLSLTNLSIGVYLFRITVTDNEGATDFDEIKVTVEHSSVNAAPIADAGDDIQLSLPTNAVTIVGKGSDVDGTISSYSWVKISGPSVTISNGTGATVSLSDMTEGKYVFRFTVKDNSGGSAQDEVIVYLTPEIVNKAPEAQAGKDAELILPNNSITIDGTGSDVDGFIVTYAWQQVSGPDLAIGILNSSKLILKNLAEGSYQFKLTVTDNEEASGSDYVSVMVYPENSNFPPIVNLGEGFSNSLPLDSLTIEAKVSDPDGTIVAYNWQKLSGAQVTLQPNNDRLVLKDIKEGTYVFRLSVTDDDGASAFADIIITINPSNINRSPRVDAGSDMYITLPLDSVELLATANDPDGDALTVVWKQLSGSLVSLDGVGSLVLKVTNLNEGSYVFEFAATDHLGATATDQVRLFVSPLPSENMPPIAIAGADTTLMKSLNNIMIIGGSYDADGLILSYQWQLIHGPVIDNEIIYSDTLILRNLEVGEYVYRLTVMDNDSAEASDELSIIILENDLDDLGAHKVFSPDGNGIDDYWEIDNLDMVSGCRLLIFNRFGLKVFESNNYNNDWDGTYGGRTLPEGDYYYVIKCDDKAKVASGGVRIIKDY